MKSRDKRYNIFKPIIGNKELKINLNGDVIDIFNNKIDLKIDKDNMVKIDMFNEIRYVNFEILKLMSYFEIGDMYNIEDKLSNISFVKVEENNKVLTNISNYIMVFRNPVNYIKTEFRIIPNYVRYAIDKSGNVLDTKTNTMLEKNIHNTDNGYYIVNLYSPDQCRSRAIFIHRLLGYAWLVNDDVKNKIVINHIDGNKLNNDISNLEWTTMQENCQHAMDTGLNSSTKPIKVFDRVTNKLTTFISLSQFLRSINLEYTGHLGSLLRKHEGNLFKGRYEIKNLDDKTEFFYRRPENKYYLPGKTCINYIVKNLKTRKILNFNRKHVMKKVLNLYIPDRIKHVGKEELVNYLNGKYKDYDFSFKIIMLTGPYIVVDLKNNNKQYKTLSLLNISDLTDIDHNIIRTDLLYGIKRKYNNRWIIYTFEPYKKVNYDEYKTYYTENKYIITSNKNSFKKSFPSIRSAAKYLDIDKGCLLRSLKTKQPTLAGYIIQDVSKEIWE